MSKQDRMAAARVAHFSSKSPDGSCSPEMSPLVSPVGFTLHFALHFSVFVPRSSVFVARFRPQRRHLWHLYTVLIC